MTPRDPHATLATPDTAAADPDDRRTTAEEGWRPLVPMRVDPDGVPITGVVEYADPDDPSPARSGVERRGPGRVLPWRPLGRWWSGDQDGRIYVLGRPKPRGDDPGDPGRRVPRWALRTLWRIGLGHHAVGRRVWDAATNAAIREQIRRARAAGDRDALGEWIQRLEEVKAARRSRIRELPQVVIGLAVGAGAAAGAAGVLVGGGGIVIGLTHPAGWGWTDWWRFWGDVVHYSAVVGVVGLQVAFWAAIPGWLYGTWRAGALPAGAMPGWLSPALTGEQEDVPITPSLVVTALRDLGITSLTKSIRAMPDHGAGMLSLVTTAGCGVQVDIALPSGTETADVRKKHSKLAENLHRHPHELHLTIPKAARTIRAWVADPGALDEPIGPSPLVYAPDLRADYERGGAPWGNDLRGDPVPVALYQRHVLVTGLSNHGKTAALRSLALWLAQDVRPQFRIGDLKGAGDWAMFAGLAETLIEGPTDDHVVLVTHMLEGAVEEMERRLLAPKGTKWNPLIVIVDEAQVAFMCPKKGPDGRPYGGTKATSRYFMAARYLHNQGRAVDVLLWQGTQDPTDENLPKLVREGAHLRASCVLGTEAQARQALSDAAVDGGAAPHKLRQGLDKGTLVVFGDAIRRPPGQVSTTVRTHFIDDDPATEIAERAKGRRAAVETDDGTGPTEPRDELADLYASLRGEDKVGTTTVLGRLAEIDRRHYEGWTHDELKALCERHGFKPRKISTMFIVADDVRQALASREQGAPPVRPGASEPRIGGVGGRP